METPPANISKKKNFTASLTKSTLTPCRRPGLSRPSSSGLNKSCHRNVVGTPNPNGHGAIVVNQFKCSEPISSVDSNLKLICDTRHKEPLNCDTASKHNVVRKVRRCLTNSASRTLAEVKCDTGDIIEGAPVEDNSQICKKFKPSLGLINSNKKIGECSDLENSSSSFVHKVDSSVISTKTMVKLSKFDKNSSSVVVPTEIVVEVDDLGEEVTLEIIDKLVQSIQEKKKKLEQLKVQETYAKKHNLEELRAQTAKWKTAGQEALEYSVSLAKHAGYSVTKSQLMIQHGFPRHLMGYNSEDDDFE